MSKFKQFLTNPAFQSEEDKYFEDQAIFLLQKQKLERIDNFNGYFDFLNNEYPCSVYFEGIIYKSVAHAYQAARSLHQFIKEKIAYADTLVELYEIAAEIDDPPNWQSNRIKVMEACLRDKFRRNKILMEKLKSTGNRDLINTYADNTISNMFWGMVDNKGQNQLGRLLMQIRFDIFSSTDLEKWLYLSYELQEEKLLIPEINLEVRKQGQKIETIQLKQKEYTMMGSLKTCDIIMAHQSISRKHFIILITQNQGVCGIDVGSKGGTYLDSKKMEPHVLHALKTGQVLSFALSTRKYHIDVDYLKVEKNYHIMKKQILKNIEGLKQMEDPDITKPSFMQGLGTNVEDTLFVSNLPKNCNQRDIEKLFGQYGSIKSVRLPIDRNSGQLRGIGFVVFNDPDCAQKALQLDRVEFQQHRLYINIAQSKEDNDNRHKSRQVDDHDRRKKQQENQKSRKEKRRRRSRSRSRSRKYRRH